MEKDREFLTVKEVAKKLRIGDLTVYRLLKDGRLEGSKVGKSWRIPHESIDKLIEENKNTRGSEKNEGTEESGN